ncbi:MAG: DUF952 domain-containing protein [Pseudomonadota bacterium]
MVDQIFAYKILSASDWRAAEAEGVTKTDLDLADGYVHLSTRKQVGETLSLHYAGVRNTRLLEFRIDDLGDLRWETSRGGDLFPHLYEPLQIKLAVRTWQLSLNDEGIPRLPEDL